MSIYTKQCLEGQRFLDAINEDDKLVFHKKGVDITNNIFTTYIKYTEINRLIIE